jgi:hypothetical protein
MVTKEHFTKNAVPPSDRQGIINKYDTNGDGVFDTNELNFIMDDFMSMMQTNKSLADTNSIQKKMIVGAFLLIILLSISNLGTALLAMNMSKEVVVVNGKIMANGGSQEEAISTMTSVRTLTKKFPDAPHHRDRHRRILQGNIFSQLQGHETSAPATEDDNDEVVCFTSDEVDDLFDSAVDGSGTNIVLEATAEKGSKSTTVIPISGGVAHIEGGGGYSFSNVQFVPVYSTERCAGETHRNLASSGRDNRKRGRGLQKKKEESLGEERESNVFYQMIELGGESVNLSSEDVSFEITTDYAVNESDIQCTFEVVKAAFIDQVYARYTSYGGSVKTSDTLFWELFNVKDDESAKTAVASLCKEAQANLEEINFDDITYEQGAQFLKLHYSGRGAWNEETETLLFPSDGEKPAHRLSLDAFRVKNYYEISKKALLRMPTLTQFDPSVCTAHAAMCCWPRDRQANDNNGNCREPYDSRCVDKDPVDNTDVCYNELDKAPYANGVKAGGFSIYQGDEAVQCKGFAWSSDENEISSRYKGNTLFHISMYDKMYRGGYVGNIPGSPMCGCVEHMPVVDEAGCTQPGVQESYKFTKADISYTAKIEEVNLSYDACKGANNINNDLGGFVQQLVNDGKLSTDEQTIFSKRVVGVHGCSAATTNFLRDNKGFETGHIVNTDKWTFIVGTGYDDETPILDYRILHKMIKAQETPIVRRVCPSCDGTLRDIYYRRLTTIPDDENLLKTLADHDFDREDFAMYYDHLDAYLDMNRLTSSQMDEMNLTYRSANHAFMILADPSFK